MMRGSVWEIRTRINILVTTAYWKLEGSKRGVKGIRNGFSENTFGNKTFNIFLLFLTCRGHSAGE